MSKATVDKTIPFKTFKKVVDTNEIVSRENTIIASFNQQLFTVTTNKIDLSSYYDKMYMINNIDCQPFGFNPKENMEYYTNFINN